MTEKEDSKDIVKTDGNSGWGIEYTLKIDVEADQYGNTAFYCRTVKDDNDDENAKDEKLAIGSQEIRRGMSHHYVKGEILEALYSQIDYIFKELDAVRKRWDTGGYWLDSCDTCDR